MKATFVHSVEWSDWSEHSPSHRGQLPCAVVLPDSERVELDEEARYYASEALYQAMIRGSKATYAQVHPNVRVREEHWGDDSSRRQGRAGSTLEVLAPKGSTFLFNRGCPWCGGKTGEATEDELVHGKAKLLWHESCQAESDEQERLIEESRREQAEWERQEHERWEREYSSIAGDC